MTKKSGWSRFLTVRWLLIILVGALACYIPATGFLRSLFSPYPFDVGIMVDTTTGVETIYGEITPFSYILTYLDSVSGLLSIVLLIVIAMLLERPATITSIVLCLIELLAIILYSYTSSYHGEYGWLSIPHGILLLIYVLYGSKLRNSIWGIIWPVASLAITILLASSGFHLGYGASFAPDILIMLVLCKNFSIKRIVASLRSFTTQESMQSTHKCAVVSTPKSKVVAALLAFFLGTIGTHRYYLRYKKQGIMQTFGCASIIIGYFSLFYSVAGRNVLLLIFSVALLLYGIATYIWVFIDFIRILTGSLTPADGSSYKENQPTQVQVIQPAPSSADSVAALEKLAALHQQGILTDEEFQQKKNELLTKI